MDQSKNYASFWIRFFAQMLDTALWGLFATLGIFYLTSSYSANLETFFQAMMWLSLVLVVILFLFKVYVSLLLITKFGGDIGKLLFGLRIEHEDSSLLTFKRAAFRELIAKIASNTLFGVGYYYIFKNEKRQGWHDLLSDTYVVKKSSSAIYVGIIVLFLIIVLNLALLVFSAMNLSKNKQLMVELSNITRAAIEDNLQTPPAPPPPVNLP